MPAAARAAVDLAAALAPLAEWYARAGEPLPAVQAVAPAKMPEPYRALLVHPDDMTSVLEKAHGSPIRLWVLSSARAGDLYRREVSLRGPESNRPVEFGAIRIHFDALPRSAQELVLRQRQPLGAILHRCRVDFQSAPTLFFRLRSDSRIARALGLDRRRVLYGRCNRLNRDDGRPIAEVVEILPPAVSSSSSSSAHRERRSRPRSARK